MSLKKRSIDAKTARVVIDACVARSKELDKKMSIAITDEAGHLRAFNAMDGAAHLSIELAQNKAWTASSFGIPTHAWWDFVKNDPPLLNGIVHHPRLVIFGGGYPLVEKGEMIGALGVSGGHYSDDMEVARAGLAVLETLD
ncbi:GlcG/HbpS family heme-binding protein [Acuticoccus sp.]|uniref:GlcG/HbpS family heme-binding protein n=1 Tax=Acuticoccus sp. TaxID=1904378 RepID=UPI003B51D8C2